MRFGVRITYLINLLQPEVVMVSEISQGAQTLFFDSLRSAIKRWTFGDAAKTVKIITSQLKEDSVALGMAALLCRDVYSQV